MQITRITFLSREASEAEVELVGGDHRCLAFSCPFVGEVGQEITEPLHVFGIGGAMVTDDKSVCIRKLRGDRLEQHVVAEVIDHEASLLRVGGIDLVVDGHLPGGISNGDLIEFDCARIDLW